MRALVVSLCLLPAFLGCGRSSPKINRSQTPSNKLFVAMDGSKIDDSLIKSPTYKLICNEAEELLATVVATSPGLILDFGTAQLKDGSVCHLEVRGESSAGFLWTSNPESPGLFYISSESKAEKNRLALTIYQVFRENTDSEKDPLSISITDGGLCDQFDLQALSCLTVTPIKNPKDGIDTPDGGTENPSPTDKESVVKAFGLNFKDTDYRGVPTVRLEGVSSDATLNEQYVTAGFLLLVDGTSVETAAQAYGLIAKLMNDISKSKILLNLVNPSSDAYGIWLDLAAARGGDK